MGRKAALMVFEYILDERAIAFACDLPAFQKLSGFAGSYPRQIAACRLTLSGKCAPTVRRTSNESLKRPYHAEHLIFRVEFVRSRLMAKDNGTEEVRLFLDKGEAEKAYRLGRLHALRRTVVPMGISGAAALNHESIAALIQSMKHWL